MLMLLNANLPNHRSIGREFYDDVFSNTGNPYITYTIINMFGISFAESIIINSCSRPDDASLSLFSRYHATCDRIILVLQDFIREDFPDQWYVECMKYLEMLESGAPKLVVMSLGANAFSPSDQDFDFSVARRLSDTKKEFFRMLSKVALSIGVRGIYARSLLELIGVNNADVIGCPSYYVGGPNRIVRRPNWADHNKLIGFNGILCFHGSLDVHMYLQGDHDWPIAEIVYGDAPQISPEWLSWLQSAPRTSLIRGLAEGRVHLFADPDAWGLHVASHCHGMIGSRLHGAIVALNAGVPAIVISGDARARETCAHFCIPWKPTGLDRLSEDYLRNQFEEINLSQINSVYCQRYNEFKQWSRRCGLALTHRRTWKTTVWQPKKQSYGIAVERLWEASSAAKRNSL